MKFVIKGSKVEYFLIYTNNIINQYNDEFEVWDRVYSVKLLFQLSAVSNVKPIDASRMTDTNDPVTRVLYRLTTRIDVNKTFSKTKTTCLKIKTIHQSSTVTHGFLTHGILLIKLKSFSDILQRDLLAYDWSMSYDKRLLTLGLQSLEYRRVINNPILYYEIKMAY